MLQDITLIAAHYPCLMPVIALLFGAVVGSFLNLLTWRLPIMLMQDWREQSLGIIRESTDSADLVQSIREQLPTPKKPFNLVRPGSSCPECGASIRPWHNIPVFGFFIVRGKCATCAAPISLRYPAVEAATAILTALVILVLGPTLQGLAGCVLTWALIALALIDLDHQLLPDEITLPLLWAGLVVNYFEVLAPFHSAFMGAVLGYLLLWAVFHLFRLVTGKEGMGFGDFKMLAMLGAWMGMMALPLIVLISSLLGTLVGLSLVFGGRDRAQPIQFGPFLAIAGFVALLWGSRIADAWLLWPF